MGRVLTPNVTSRPGAAREARARVTQLVLGFIFAQGPFGCGSKLNDRRGKPQVVVHVSTYQGKPFWYLFLSHSHLATCLLSHHHICVCVWVCLEGTGSQNDGSLLVSLKQTPRNSVQSLKQNVFRRCKGATAGCPPYYWLPGYNRVPFVDHMLDLNVFTSPCFGKTSPAVIDSFKPGKGHTNTWSEPQMEAYC